MGGEGGSGEGGGLGTGLMPGMTKPKVPAPEPSKILPTYLLHGSQIFIPPSIRRILKAAGVQTGLTPPDPQPKKVDPAALMIAAIVAMAASKGVALNPQQLMQYDLASLSTIASIVASGTDVQGNLQQAMGMDIPTFEQLAQGFTSGAAAESAKVEEETLEWTQEQQWQETQIAEVLTQVFTDALSLSDALPEIENIQLTKVSRTPEEETRLTEEVDQVLASLSQASLNADNAAELEQTLDACLDKMIALRNQQQDDQVLADVHDIQTEFKREADLTAAGREAPQPMDQDPQILPDNLFDQTPFASADDSSANQTIANDLTQFLEDVSPDQLFLDPSPKGASSLNSEEPPVLSDEADRLSGPAMMFGGMSKTAPSAKNENEKEEDPTEDATPTPFDALYNGPTAFKTS